MSKSSIRADEELRYLNNGRDLQGYCDQLFRFYTTERTKGVSYDRWRVVKLRLYKDRSQREYLVAKVLGPKDIFGEPLVYLRIQRMYQDQTAVYLDSTRPPNDITRLDPSCIADTEVKSVTFEKSFFISLPRLAILARTIDCLANRPTGTRSAHWFTHSILEVLQHTYLDHIKVKDLKKSNNRRSSVLPVRVLNDFSTKAVVQEYYRQWATFNDEVRLFP
ncbi:hypothetical protein AMATHDRAFT_49532 [Amanita thiersii Skay4041]|uniref:Uncharacterized protein n=1 Tax=Amanita thiersii Skay4041 TaxID=703135 RepID=A0A2A9NL46_9AGAR|nr:hypothetical protein AMATHDRAFT_49532 [Amanita thiersii Skay4041]